MKLIDFGFSTVVHGDFLTTNYKLGTPYFEAPEIVNCRSHTVKVDVWATGCLLYYLLTGKHLFYSKNQEDTARKILDGRLVFDEGGSPEQEKAIDFIKSCLCKVVLSRSSAKELLDHPWMLPC